MVRKNKVKEVDHSVCYSAHYVLWNHIPHLPMELNGNLPVKMSKSSLRRLLDSGGVRLNGVYPKADDEIDFPITELVFFPNGKRKTTMI